VEIIVIVQEVEIEDVIDQEVVIEIIEIDQDQEVDDIEIDREVKVIQDLG
jgi:hypothetical protein